MRANINFLVEMPSHTSIATAILFCISFPSISDTLIGCDDLAVCHHQSHVYAITVPARGLEHHKPFPAFDIESRAPLNIDKSILNRDRTNYLVPRGNFISQLTGKSPPPRPASMPSLTESYGSSRQPSSTDIEGRKLNEIAKGFHEFRQNDKKELSKKSPNSKEKEWILTAAETTAVTMEGDLFQHRKLLKADQEKADMLRKQGHHKKASRLEDAKRRFQKSWGMYQAQMLAIDKACNKGETKPAGRKNAQAGTRKWRPKKQKTG